ncbi:MAG: transposase zinc-binding domain-containing protein [Burkholderiales bacterium]
MEEDGPAIYRPRRPRASPLWQCVSRHLPELRAGGRVRRAVERNVLERFLECGDLDRGFARIRCGGCGHDLLLAFSCKTRYFCPSCHQKRVLAYGLRGRSAALPQVRRADARNRADRRPGSDRADPLMARPLASPAARRALTARRRVGSSDHLPSRPRHRLSAAQAVLSVLAVSKFAEARQRGAVFAITPFASQPSRREPERSCQRRPSATRNTPASPAFRVAGAKEFPIPQ